MSNVGTAPTGYIYTANGVGEEATFQPSSGSFTPNSTIMLSDDFIGTNPATVVFTGSLSWVNIGGQDWTFATASATNPGIISSPSLTTSDTGFFLGANGGTIVTPISLGGGAIQANWVIKIPTLSNSTNRYNLRFGFGDTSGADEVNGVYFAYSDNLNSGDFVGKTAKASTRTSADSAITAEDTAFHNFGITINAAGTSASFFIDGTQIANSPIITNLPTVGITPFLDLVHSSGTIAAGSIIVDLFYMTQVLTTSR